MFGLFKSKETVKTFTPVELHDRLRARDGACLLVDVREDTETASGRIPGAIKAPLSRFADAVARLSKEKPVIFYCQGGMRSQRALDMARDHGLNAEGHLGGGIAAWRGAGLPVEA